MPLKTTTVNAAGILGLEELPFPPGFSKYSGGAPILPADEKAIVEAWATLSALAAPVVGSAHYTYTVATLAARPAIAAVGDGVLCFVVSQRQWYRSSVSANAWIREPYGDATWGLQTAWFVDPTNGDDENTGLTSLVPLKTYAEILARLQGVVVNPLNADPFEVVVTLMGALGATDCVGTPELVGQTGDVRWSVRGAQTTIANTVGALSAATAAINRAANLAQIIEAAALSTTWTLLGAVNKIIVITSGANAGVSATIMADLGGGNKQARVSPFRDFSDPSLGPGPIVAPPINSAFKVVNMTVCTVGNLSQPELIVTFRDVKPTFINGLVSGFIGFMRCDLASGVLAFGAATCALQGCPVGSFASALISSFIRITSCGVYCIATSQSPTGMIIEDDTVVQGAAAGAVLQNPGWLDVRSVGFFGCTTAITLKSGAIALMAGQAYGSGVGVGIRINTGVRVAYATKPTIATTVIDARFGPVPVDKAWAAIPYNDLTSADNGVTITGSGAALVAA